METEKIQLRRERDFGQVFNAAFAFIKQEFKPFVMALLIFVVPVILIVTIAITYSAGSRFGMMKNFQVDRNFDVLIKVYEYIGVVVILGLLAQCVLILTVVSYIRIYMKNQESPSMNEIFSTMVKSFLPVLGAVLLGGIVIGIGFIFCILPGIYLAVSLSLFLIALIIENDGIGNAFSRSFQLTHLQWWWTLLIILVSGIVLYVLYIILQVPAYIMGINSFMHNMHQLATAENPYTTSYIVYQSIVATVAQLVYSVPIVILTFHYFSLVEIRERPSLIQKIEELGVNE